MADYVDNGDGTFSAPVATAELIQRYRELRAECRNLKEELDAKRAERDKIRTALAAYSPDSDEA